MELKNGKYMGIEELPLVDGRKTHTYSIYELANYDNELGYIQWFGRWRKFCFFTNDNMVFDNGCLGQIIEWLNILNEDHKNKGKEEVAV